MDISGISRNYVKKTIMNSIKSLVADTTKPIKRIQKTSSVEFVQAVFRCYRHGELFVIDDKLSGLSTNLNLSFEDIEVAPGGGWLRLEYVNRADDQPAQIIFSSGTEGEPKAIVVSYKALDNVVQRLNNRMALTSEVKEYIGVPVTYSFGLGRCRAIAAVGGAAYLPANGFDVNEIVRMLADGEINAISAVPSLWRVVLEHSEAFAQLGSKVRWIEIGSQYMSADEKQAMRSLFPNAKIVQHYGLTEASRSTFLDVSACANEQALESVGVITDDVAVRINPEGRIQLRGNHLASGVIKSYNQHPHIQSITDEEGWLTTSDLGKIVDNRLYYLGRADDIINCAGVKINPEAIQARVNACLAGAAKVAICGVPDALRGEAIFVAVTDPAVLPSVLSMVDSELQQLGLNAKDAVKVQTIDAIPQTATGKVKRKELAALYRPPEQPHNQQSDSVLAVFQRYFGPEINKGQSFKSLGGDSLLYVQANIRLERLLGELPEQWENLSIADLEKIESTSNVRSKSLDATRNKRWVKLDASTLLRALAITAVVWIHAGVDAIAGATSLLFLLVGHNYARFQGDRLVAGLGWPHIARFVGIMLVPYYLFALLYLVFNREVNLALLLLYENWLGNELTLLFPFWFVQQLAQCLVILGLMSAIANRCVAGFSARINLSLLSIVVACIFSGLALAIKYIAPQYTTFNFGPFAYYLPVLLLGWASYYANSLALKITVCCLGVALAYYLSGWHSKAYWLAFGCLVLPFVHSVSLWAWLRRPLEYLAANTFYLFIANGIVIYILQYKLGVNNVIVLFAAAMAAGLLLGAVYEFSRYRLRNLTSKTFRPVVSVD